MNQTTNTKHKTEKHRTMKTLNDFKMYQKIPKFYFTKTKFLSSPVQIFFQYIRTFLAGIPSSSHYPP